MRSEVCQLRSLKTVLERQVNDLVYQVNIHHPTKRTVTGTQIFVHASDDDFR